MRFIEVLKKLIVPGPPKPTSFPNGDSALTNQKIMDELVNHFKIKLKEESFGSRMVYHMAYTILMDASDYADRMAVLGSIVEEAVSKFYENIQDKRSVYSNYTPLSNYWYFQFVPCEAGAEVDGIDGISISKGSMCIISRHYPPSSNESTNVYDGPDIDASPNVQVSVKVANSNVVSNVYVNRDVLKNIDSLGGGEFRMRFDMSLQGNNHKIISNDDTDNGDVKAIISYSNGPHTLRFKMKDNLIDISGREDDRRSRAVFVIDNDKIKKSHVQIRKEDGKFQIAAYAPIKLNQRDIKGNSGIPQWVDLVNNSKIFFVDAMLSVLFTIKQD